MTDFPNGITAALVAFQADLPKIGRTSQAQYGKYADLGEVSAAVLPALAAQGMCYTTQLVRDVDGGWLLHAEIRSETGGAVSASWPIPAGGPQLMGGVITYARRYMLLALCGVHPAGEDDDGQGAQRAAENTVKENTPDQGAVRAMFAQLTEAGIPRDVMRDEIASIIGRELDTSADMTAAEVGKVLDELRRRRREQAQVMP